MADNSVVVVLIAMLGMAVSLGALMLIVLVPRKKTSPTPPDPPVTPPDPPSDSSSPDPPSDSTPPDSTQGSKRCKISFYSSDPKENDGWTVTADGSKLDHTKNIVAVPIDVWDKYKGRKVTLNGKTYTVKDSCSICRKNGVHFDVLVSSKKVALDCGIKYWPCSLKP